MISPRKLMELYSQGKNISEILRKEKEVQYNDEEIIELAYDLQTGTYIDAMKDEAMAEHKQKFTAEISKIIQSLFDPTSIMEAGVGEATTLAGVLKKIDNPQIESYGFDLSWSRVAYARNWLVKSNISNVSLCTGSLFNIPFEDNSIDLVYTCHSIEPNGGQEEPILRELYRVTKKYLILLEPGYELAGDEARRRMEFYGYCKNLLGISQSLGYRVIEHKLFPFTENPLNPTAITAIKKEPLEVSQRKISTTKFVCPRYKTPLEEIGGMLFSPEGLVVYPILGGIPCLRIENGILASKYPEIIQAG